MDLIKAKSHVRSLITSLERSKDDGEQEIGAFALPVLDAAISAVCAAVPDNEVAASVRGAYAHVIETGEPVRVVDALLVAEQLDAAIGSPGTGSSISTFDRLMQ